MKCFTHPELSRMSLVVVGSFDVLEKTRELLKLGNIVIKRFRDGESFELFPLDGHEVHDYK